MGEGRGFGFPAEVPGGAAGDAVPGYVAAEFWKRGMLVREVTDLEAEKGRVRRKRKGTRHEEWRSGYVEMWKSTMTPTRAAYRYPTPERRKPPWNLDFEP